MTHNVIIQVEHQDQEALDYAYEHPTLRNIDSAIEYITDVGVNAITLEAKK